jgi:hypothetical protein
MPNDEKTTGEAGDVAYAQALLDATHAEVARIAKKAGVAAEHMPRALRDFAAHLRPHAGREPSAHQPRHYKRWWQGYAAGMRAGNERHPPVPPVLFSATDEGTGPVPPPATRTDLEARMFLNANAARHALDGGDLENARWLIAKVCADFKGEDVPERGDTRVSPVAPLPADELERVLP